MTREECYGALFGTLTQLQRDGTVVLCLRGVRLLEDMADAELPALCLAVGSQDQTPRRGLPPKRRLGATVILYAANPNPDTAGGIQLNGLIDALDAALRPDPLTGAQTLGGLVDHAWIEGRIEVFEGALGQRAAAIVPVSILMP